MSDGGLAYGYGSASLTSSSTSSGGPTAKYKTEFEKGVLISNFDLLRWKRTDSDRDWNFFWATVGTARSLWHPDSGIRLQDDQIVNHFPTHLELTRKDLMVKNLKRYRKEMEKMQQQQAAEMAGAGGGSAAAAAASSVPPSLSVADSSFSSSSSHPPLIDFFPLTYTLPGEFGVFVDEFKRAPPGAVWIVKPNAKSQGKGIELLHKLSQLKRWAAQNKMGSASHSNDPRHSYVVSRYIADPLLIGGKKFDLRLYCLVTSYRPLKAWQYREGFARFCNVKYSHSTNSASLANSEMHLTNVAIQKHGEGYNERHGNKWSVGNLRLYLEGTRGFQRTQKLFEQISFILIHALRSVAPRMSSDKHCFECYGFDLLLDEQLKPWLLEVNASPSLSVTTKADRILKAKLIHDLLQVVVPPDFPETHTSKGSTSWNSALSVGGFDLLYDEALLAAVPTAPASGSAGATAAATAAAASYGGAGAFDDATSMGGSTGASLHSAAGIDASSQASKPPPASAGKWR